MQSYENDIKKWSCLRCSKIITTGKVSYHYKDSIYCSKHCLFGKEILNKKKISTNNLKIINDKNEFYKIKSSCNLLSENFINLKRSNSIDESVTYSEKKKKRT